MDSIQDIRRALERLPTHEKWKIAHWLLEDTPQKPSQKSDESRATFGEARPQPDYAARRKRIFGDKSVPTFVDISRNQERW